jgi:peroxiredoxin (alkyl hydroperoxide reductase subunit C)
MGAEVVTVSTDTEYTHLAWQRHEKELAEVRYPMGADVTGRLARRFGVYDEATGLAHRGAFLIGPDGRLMAMEVTANNIGRNIDELMRKFKASLHVARHPKKACPSKWRDDGDQTLEPSAKIVGRVHDALQG